MAQLVDLNALACYTLVSGVMWHVPCGNVATYIPGPSGDERFVCEECEKADPNGPWMQNFSRAYAAERGIDRVKSQWVIVSHSEMGEAITKIDLFQAKLGDYKNTHYYERPANNQEKVLWWFKMLTEVERKEKENAKAS